MKPAYSAKVLQTVSDAAAQSVSDPQTVLYQVYAAIAAGDFDALGAFFTDDVEFSVCGFAPMNGVWRGRSAVIGAIRRNFALVESQQPEVESVIVQGDSVAVLLWESGVLKSTGQPYSVTAVQWFTFMNGKITRIDEIAGQRSHR